MQTTGTRRKNADDHDFNAFWLGETVSLLGSEIGTIALPLAAVLTLDASPAQLGIVNAARFAPFLLLTLLAGVVVDRSRKRPLMIGADLGRAVLTALIPALAVLGFLSIGALAVLAFAIGSCTVVFDVAYLAYVPVLVRPDRLVEANGKLAGSQSAAEIAGPGIGGFLVQTLSAPLALVVDAGSFLASAAGVAAIRRDETRPDGTNRRPISAEIAEGLRVTMGNPILRAIVGEAATYNLFDQVFWTGALLWITRDLGLGAAWIGALVMAGSVGGMVGAVAARRLGDRVGVGRTLVSAMVIACLALLVVPFVARADVIGIGLLLGGFAVNGFGVTVSNVHAVSLRQSAVPPELLGRMNASYRTIIWGVIPLGALLGGAVGQVFGVHVAVTLGVLGIALAPAWIIFSRVPHVRRVTDAVPDAG